MSIHQCPRCELRFRDKAEVVAHLVDDHDVDPESVELVAHPELHPRRNVPNPAPRER